MTRRGRRDPPRAHWGLLVLLLGLIATGLLLAGYGAQASEAAAGRSPVRSSPAMPRCPRMPGRCSTSATARCGRWTRRPAPWC